MKSVWKHLILGFWLQWSEAIITILVRGNGQNEVLPDKEIVKSQITKFEAQKETVRGKQRPASGILTGGIGLAGDTRLSWTSPDLQKLESFLSCIISEAGLSYCCDEFKTTQRYSFGRHWEAPNRRFSESRAGQDGEIGQEMSSSLQEKLSCSHLS